MCLVYLVMSLRSCDQAQDLGKDPQPPLHVLQSFGFEVIGRLGEADLMRVQLLPRLSASLVTLQLACPVFVSPPPAVTIEVPPELSEDVFSIHGTRRPAFCNRLHGLV